MGHMWEVGTESRGLRAGNPHMVGMKDGFSMETTDRVGIRLLLDTESLISVETGSQKRRLSPWRACRPGAWRWR